MLAWSGFLAAYKRAVKAEEYAAKDYIADAIDEWRKIFPSGFPAYG
jgi:hypothetical protein